MSVTLTFTGESSILTSDFYPELELDPTKSYSCGLLEFTTYNSIPNITRCNNKVYYSKHSIKQRAMVMSKRTHPGRNKKPKENTERA